MFVRWEIHWRLSVVCNWHVNCTCTKLTSCTVDTSFRKGIFYTNCFVFTMNSIHNTFTSEAWAREWVSGARLTGSGVSFHLYAYFIIVDSANSDAERGLKISIHPSVHSNAKPHAYPAIHIPNSPHRVTLPTLPMWASLFAYKQTWLSHICLSH